MVLIYVPFLHLAKGRSHLYVHINGLRFLVQLKPKMFTSQLWSDAKSN